MPTRDKSDLPLTTSFSTVNTTRTRDDDYLGDGPSQRNPASRSVNPSGSFPQPQESDSLQGLNIPDYSNISGNNDDDRDDGQLKFIPNDGDLESRAESTETKSRLRYLSYYVPITTWLPKYNVKKQLVRDIIAGLSVGAMLTPQSMAYASIIYLPPIHGLITALIAGIIYFFLGHSPVLTVGPEATCSILLGEAIINLPPIKAARERGETPTELIYAAASGISFLCGIVTLLFGVFRLGFVDGVFSRPVLSGFICAVGGLLLLDQTPKVLGLQPCQHHCESTTGKLKYLWEEIALKWDVNGCAMIIGIGCIIYLATFKILKAKYPNSVILSRTPHIFIMVIFCTLMSWGLDLSGKYKIRIIGTQASSWPTPAFPTFGGDDFSQYLSTAIILAVLGFVETQLVNKTVQLPNTTISPNRELVALGTIHVIASIFGGYAAFGSLTRTRVSMSAGTSSQIANLVAISIVLLSLIVLMNFFAYLPHAVTGGIVWFVATSLLETHETKFTFKTKQWLDFGLNIIMIIITFFFGVDIGLFFAFASCLLLVIKQQNKPSVRLLGRFGDKTSSQSVDTVDDQGQSGTNEQYVEFGEHASLHQSLEGILIYQIDGPLFFCNAENLKDRMRRIEIFGSVVSHPSQPPHPLALRAIIFDLQSVTSIDATAAAVLQELVEDYHKRNIRVVFVKLRKSLLPLLIDAGITKILGMHNFKRSVNAAVEHVEEEERQDKLNQQQEQENLFVGTEQTV